MSIALLKGWKKFSVGLTNVDMTIYSKLRIKYNVYRMWIKANHLVMYQE